MRVSEATAASVKLPGHAPGLVSAMVTQIKAAVHVLLAMERATLASTRFIGHRDVLFSHGELTVPRFGSEHQAGGTRKEQNNRYCGGKCQRTIEFHNSFPRVSDDYAEHGQ